MKSKNKPKREKKKGKKAKVQPKINTVTGYFNPWLYSISKWIKILYISLVSIP